MYAASNALSIIIPLCCGSLFFLAGAGLLIYALIQRKKVADSGQPPAQNNNLFIILGAVTFVLSLCVCSLSVILPLILNR